MEKKRNLDQIRAKNAMAAVEEKKFFRQDVAGFPALIIQNGLLAAFAYASEAGKGSRQGLKDACDKTAEHLASHGIKVLESARDCDGLIKALSKEPATSLDLQRATSEALLFFGYLKRFTIKE